MDSNGEVPGAALADPLVIAGRSFGSRLIVGTGKFGSFEVMRDAIAASGTEMVTVALRRVDLDATGGPDILEYIDADRYLLLPNTSGAVDADEAVRIARLARAAGLPTGSSWRSRPSPGTCCPTPWRRCARPSGWWPTASPCCRTSTPTPSWPSGWRRPGCATVMPLGSWIGSNQGVRTRDAVRIIVEQATVPVVVDAGLGAPSHAAEAMELGADAVLVNTAIAVAGDPVEMARAFAAGVEAGRRAFLAGRAPERVEAEASSPLTGFLEPKPVTRATGASRSPGRPARTGVPRSAAVGDVRGGAGSRCRSTRCSSGRAARRPADVERVLARQPLERTLEDFAALLSPAAGERLEELAAASRRLTLARFGRTMHLYAPLYLSNECLTTCVYCGFARELPIARRTLTPEETLAEARHLVARGVPFDPAADRGARAPDRRGVPGGTAAAAGGRGAVAVDRGAGVERGRVPAPGRGRVRGRRRVPGDVPPGDVRPRAPGRAASATSSGGCWARSARRGRACGGSASGRCSGCTATGGTRRSRSRRTRGS